MVVAEEKQKGGGYLGPAFVCGHRWEASLRKEGPGDCVWWCLSSGEQGAFLCEGAKEGRLGEGTGNECVGTVCNLEERNEAEVRSSVLGGMEPRLKSSILEPLQPSGDSS